MGCQNLQFWALANQCWVDARVLGPATGNKMMREKSRRHLRMNLAEAQMREKSRGLLRMNLAEAQVRENSRGGLRMNLVEAQMRHYTIRTIGSRC